MNSEQALLADLDSAGVVFTVHEHIAVATVEDSAEVTGHIPGYHTKNLFLKDKAGRYWLVTMPGEERADLRFIASRLGAGRFSFGKPEAMKELLGVTPGAVTPLAAFNDRAGKVTVVLDAAFAPDGTINVHPLRNTATLSLRTTDLVAALERWGHAPLVLSLQPED
ncbi:prolyl-tRNA synthetase associated domain-containing protein [Novosphingobium mathurense]|uniref:Ala-tRNA(Pro) deacylase n=1 Tax=Novosphingobium mathurense TaxID=428990 RepID=A0A1U6HVP6_9SPHN|nr:prolyl-tRNA synthetase associated domain-containing protein [Novosphingobium mathurense]SLJ99880.1 Ala-tRNA(Pro) deacylase [Novosphingobium mathurense]